MELELVKQNIHMNRWKNQISTQITLDDDFIVPDTMDDIAQVILSAGEIQLDPFKIQNEKVILRGKLDFHILYQKEEGGLQALGGNIPFDEIVNVPGLMEHDYVSIGWQIEDLHAELINSRKLSIQAIVILEIKTEELYDMETVSDLAQNTDSSDARIECRKNSCDVAAIALRRKDTHRIREEITVPGTKSGIGRLLWTEMRLAGVTVRPLDRKVHLDGTLLVFVIYEGEGDQPLVQWVEEAIPFSGDVDMTGAVPEMIPAVSTRLIHKAVEEKPDYDGEMRLLDVDAVVEMDIRLYQEKTIDLLTDLYATNREMEVQTKEAVFDKILMHNTAKCRIAEKIPVRTDSRILQICHSIGGVKIDEAEVSEDGQSLSIDGVLDVKLLYLTDDDNRPVQSTAEMIPFHYDAETPGASADSVWHLEAGLEHMTAAMSGGDMVEIKAVITLELLMLQPIGQQVVERVVMKPLDTKKLQQVPGIVGYMVQPQDVLWDIAKRFHTTMDTIIETNHLSGEVIHPGESLILVKEITR